MPSSASLAATGLARWTDARPASPDEEQVLQQSQALERFLAEVERRALRIAAIAVRDPDEAMDIVQGAMIRLARHYAGRPSEEWRPLFYRILQNGIRDSQRRRAVRTRVFGWWPERPVDADGAAPDPLEQVPDRGPGLPEQLMAADAMQRLEAAISDLPRRQREAFTLRCLEGLDVAQTAVAMGCSEGSVKTHYFRALQVLRGKLGEAW